MWTFRWFDSFSYYKIIYYTIFCYFCRVFNLVYKDFGIHLISRDASPLQSVGPQKCLAFSTDGAKFAVGGEV